MTREQKGREGYMVQPAPEPAALGGYAARLVRMQPLPPAPAAPTAASERRQAFDYRARPLMALDCRFEGGQRKAFKYPDLISCEFDGGSRITLYFEAVTVTLEGRNLGEGYGHLVEGKVAAVQERHCSEFELEGQSPYVEAIRLSAAEPNGPARLPAAR